MADTGAIIWTVLLDAGLGTSTAWKAWAEREVAVRDHAPHWLLDVLAADDRATAASAFHAAPREASVDVTSLRLGLLYVRHTRGELSARDLVVRAGELADAANYGEPDCEAFFALANELENRAGPAHSAGAPSTRIDALFARHVAYLTSLALSTIAGVSAV